MKTKNQNINDIKYDNDSNTMTKNNFGENNNAFFENMKIISLVIHLPTDHLRKVKTRIYIYFRVSHE